MTRKIVGFLVTIAGIVSWDQYLYPPIAHYRSQPTVGMRGTLAELIKPTNAIYHDGICLGWIFLVVSLLLFGITSVLVIKLIRFAITYIGDSEVEISILSMDVQLFIHDVGFGRGTVSRNQKLHANRVKTSAFFTNFAVDAPSGKINSKSIDADSLINGKRVTHRPHRIRGDERRIEFTEMFSTPLPVSLWATYLPNGVVLWLHEHGLFQKVILHRTASIDYIDEYCAPDPVFRLTAARYPVTRVTLKLDFPEQTAPGERDIKAVLLRSNAVQALDLGRLCSHGRCIYTVKLNKLKGATLSVEWNDTALVAYGAATFANPPSTVP